METTLDNSIWHGRVHAVATARKRYQENPEGELVPFAVALYSFRSNAQFRVELLKLRAALTKRAQYLLRNYNTGTNTAEFCDLADTVSTHLEWIARHADLAGSDYKDLLHLAQRLATCGMEKARTMPSSHHSFSLLTLTVARICIEQNQLYAAEGYLSEVRMNAPVIADASQRARAYRKLGMLYHKTELGFYWGVKWGIRACLVPNIPLAVRAKSLAALLGIDR